MSTKTYILKKECRNIGKETGDYYNGEYGDSPEKIADLIARGVIEEEVPEVPEKPIDLIVWDLETTGFVAPEAKILEIGCLVVRGEEVEQKHWVLKHEGLEIPEKIIELTGITQDIIDAEGRDPKECLQEFLPLFKDCKKNVTHNGIRFDIPFLIASAAAHFGYQPQEVMAVTNLIRSTAHDTAVEYKAKRLEMAPFFRESYAQFADRVMGVKAFGLKFNLGQCCDDTGVDRTGVIQHRALGDVDLTYRLYQKTYGATDTQKV